MPAVRLAEPNTMAASWSLQCLKSSRSSAGMPRSSAITIAGRGNAKSRTRSGSSMSARSSSSSSTISSIRGRRSVTRDGVNVRRSGSRNRACSGSSWNTIQPRSRSKVWPIAAREASSSRPSSGVSRSLESRWSWKPSLTASWVVNIHARCRVSHTIGPISRSAAKMACGSAIASGARRSTSLVGAFTSRVRAVTR